MKSSVVLSARDRNFDLATEFGKTVIVIPVQWFFEPVNVEVLQLDRRLIGALETPPDPWLPVAARLGLVSVDHDGHFASHRFPYSFDRPHVLGNRFVVQSQLDSPPAIVAQRSSQFSALFRCGKADHAGVRNHPVFPAAPEPVEREVRRFAHDVPQRDIDTRYALVVQIGNVVTERSGVLLDIEGALADEVLFHRVNKHGMHGRSNTGDPSVRMHFHK